ncbi:flagellar hook-associated protein FlgL [Paenibacillus glacialis]|nr:flagellar hook-associated protein FlgL [Paenibacillus glacialis]
MRITNNMLSSQLLTNLNRNAQAMSHTQEQLSTARKLNKPSDDPVGITYSLRYRSELSSNDQYQRNVDSAMSWLDHNDTVLGQAGDVVQRLRALTVQAATGTNPKSALDSIKAEVVQLKEQLVDIANSQLNGKYIFNGQTYDKKPYDTTLGEPEKAVTDVGTVNFVMGDSVIMPISVTGSSVFGEVSTTVPDDSDNLFSVINRITNALDTENFSALSGELTNLDTRMETMLRFRSEIGAKTNRVELMQNRLSSLGVNLTDLQSKTEDADYAGTILQSKIQENIYNASLSAGSKIISPSLMDFLR